jgi:hypothetical protein
MAIHRASSSVRTFACIASDWLPLQVHVHKRLTVGVTHNVAIRNLFDEMRTCGTLPVDVEYGECSDWGFIARYPFGTASLAFLNPTYDACRFRLLT